MIGQGIHRFAQVLWTHNRSLTGEGVRQTLNQFSPICRNWPFAESRVERRFSTGLCPENGV